MEAIFNSWPLAAIICFVAGLLIFRGPIVALIGRLRRFKVPGGELDLSGEQEQKKIETTIATTGVTVPATTALPPPSNVYASIEQEIKNAMAASKLPADVEKAWLIRTIATWKVARGHEIVYRLILGSQLGLLLQANTAAPPNTDSAREMYEAAKTAYPNMYKDFSFETWVRFPINAGLVREEASVLQITPLGQDFLQYLVRNSLTNLKYG
jgi:hypothetical protein